MFMEQTTEQLMNLRCRDLSEFKWYKDVLLSAIYTREDSNQDFWKEKFISGLPLLFAKRVKERLRAKYDGGYPLFKVNIWRTFF